MKRYLEVFHPLAARKPQVIWNRLRPSVAVALIATLVSACGGEDAPNQYAAPPATTAPISSAARVLNIAPIAQQTEVWCWAASAEMVFRYYGLPNLNPAGNFQCGIVAAYAGPQSACWSNCFACLSGIGPVSQIQVLINNYGPVANIYLPSPSRVLTSRLLFNYLSFDNLAQQINSGQPIIAGVSPSGYAYPNISEHVVVIVGYRNDASGQRVIVNDPFPYQAFPTQQNPYFKANGSLLQLGQYSVPYSTFISQMKWANTVDQIR